MPNSTDIALIARERAWLHSEIIRTGTLAINASGIATNADKGNKPSREIASGLARRLMSETHERQNSRTEALNLIRNRKGQTPHIVVVTGEPLPSRIASLALGTGDIDCMYHFALYELTEAVEEYAYANGREDIVEQLDTLIAGKRLKDISDLPLDLCL